MPSPDLTARIEAMEAVLLGVQAQLDLLKKQLGARLWVKDPAHPEGGYWTRSDGTVVK